MPPRLRPQLVFIFLLCQTNLASMISTATEDILLMIFDNAVGPTRISWPKDEYDIVRARAPFQLAAVCHRWRDLALKTSTLWAYFGFPSPLDDQEHHLARLHVLISRSSHAPIDVLFAHKIGAFEAVDGRTDEPAISVQIIDALIGLVFRWRSAQVRMPSLPFRHNLARDAPLLEQLYMTDRSSTLEMPRAPRLVRLGLDTYQKGDLSFSPSLSSLRSCIVYSSDAVLAELVCTIYAQSLVDLCISDDLWNDSFGLIDFPCLRVLTLDDPTYLEGIRAPKLKTLAVNAGRLKHHIPSSPPRFPDLDHLILYGSRMVYSELEVLGDLSSISRLSFIVPAAIKATIKTKRRSHISRGFFAEFSTSTAYPQLVHVNLSSDAVCNTGRLDFDEFSAFVKSRTLQLDMATECALGSQLQPRRLSSVIIEGDSVPDRFRNEIQQYIHPPATLRDV
ncbi:hypothetical protein BKA62DRAFT_704355 [Auriculariales sp. MPI-PUGE-AT-0066]|nr:hypothetical protein BKA62DRAFT_704355 [Auriculariales sp. MPI-PUGE-AT-0066]